MAFYSFYLNYVCFTGCLTGSVRVKKNFGVLSEKNKFYFFSWNAFERFPFEKKELTVSEIA